MPRASGDGAVGWRRGRAILTLALTLALVVFGAVRADEPEATSPSLILVVDLQEAMSRSLAMAAVQTELQDLRQSYQDEFVALEQEFREIEQRLTREDEGLSEAELRERRREFELRVSEAQHRVQDRRMALDRGQAEAVNQIRRVLLEIVTEVAEDQGAQLVLAKNQVVVVDRALDITDEVISRLNERLPSVAIAVEDDDDDDDDDR